MASEVFSGSSNFSYKNNTGQNVRVVINYMEASNVVNISNIFGQPSYNRSRGIVFTWAGVSIDSTLLVIGRNLATSFIDIKDAPNTPVYATPLNNQITSVATYSSYGVVHNDNAIATTNTFETSYAGGGSSTGSRTTGSGALPTEIMLRPGQTFSATCGVYNVVVIPENG